MIWYVLAFLAVAGGCTVAGIAAYKTRDPIFSAFFYMLGGASVMGAVLVLAGVL
jgi:hypothetical protein